MTTPEPRREWLALLEAELGRRTGGMGRRRE
jgi:hypothetical protein